MVTLRPFTLFILAFVFSFNAASAAPFSFKLPLEAQTLSNPVIHENLAIYFVMGPSAKGPVPLTLEEAMADNLVKVIETGDVDQLKVQNLSDQEIFIQSGDIVKGGKQDRVLQMSMILPPNSDAIPIDSFCVEQGRWSQREGEEVTQFASSAKALPTRAAKLAMKAPESDAKYGGKHTRQSQVWANVSGIQDKLSHNLETEVKDEKSQSSLQLALENERLKEQSKAYDAAFKTKGEEKAVLGYVVAINGKLSSADIYPSNGLHKKMWEKNLQTIITEAIASEDEYEGEAMPKLSEAQAFLQRGNDKSKATSKEDIVVTGILLETQETEDEYGFVTKREDGDFVHRNILAK